MQYQKIYDALINRAKSQNRSKRDFYYESHHIIPRCMDGTDDENNLVLLSAREHFIAHRLLCKIHPNNKSLTYSLLMMLVGTKYVKRDFHVPSKLYEELRKFNSDQMKLNNPMFNRESVEKMKSTRISRIASGEIDTSKCRNSEETCKRISERMKGDNNPMRKYPERNKARGNSYVKGRKWYNNGTENKYLKDGDEIPEGFVEGMMYKPRGPKKKRNKDHAR